MREFERTTLGSLLLFSNGRSSPPRADGLPYPVYGSNGVIGFAGETNAANNTIIIGRVGSYCGSLYFSETACWVTDNAIRASARERNCSRFLFYLLSTLNLNNWRAGSGQPLINQEILSHIPALAPEPPEQVAIAEVLGALDDKIDLNRRINETLEAMARAIFKDWFVDFGPTRAKMEGLAPYLAPEMWALFPDRLDDESKPGGWKGGTLGDIALQVGESISPETLAPETPYIGLEHMPRRSVALEDWEGAGKVTSGKLAFKRGDFLFGKLRPYFHKVGIAPLDGICSTDIVVLNAKSPEARSFIISCISQDEYVAFTDRTSDGTKMPRTSWGRMAKYEICIPTPPIFEAFDKTASPLFERLIANIHESKVLAGARDLLLPKLMSGEIRVSDAERLVGQAAC